MTGGKNGSTPAQNLAQLRRKPVFETVAEVEPTKCPSHPTKRMWEDPMDAVREAEVRSIAAKMPIAAYRCDACGNAHLCKASSVRPGSLLTRPEPELPLVLGNADAKRKALREFLDGRSSATTDELMALLEVGRKSVGSYMTELDWYNTRGRNARWVPDATTAVVEITDFIAQPKRHLEVVEASKSRHPSAQFAGWEPMLNLDSLAHIPLGDLVLMLAAQGRELRIQTRSTS
jgi:hypothetical protein